MSLNTTSNTGTPTSLSKRSDVTIETKTFGTIQITLPAQWDISDPDPNGENTIPCLQGDGGTRIELSEITLSNNDIESVIQAKLLIADPPYSPPNLETSVMIPTADTAQEQLNKLFEKGDR